MPRRTVTQQFSFSNGMLDPSLEARTDVKAYHNGARELTNMLGLAQGGVETRGGLRHVAELSLTPGQTEVRLARFAFSFEVTYLVAFSHQSIRIFAGDSEVGSVSGGYDADELADLAWTQSLDTMILVHPDYEPKRLVRLGGGSSWELQTLPLTHLPTFNFDAPTAGNGTPNGTTGTITITSDQNDFDKVAIGGSEPTYWVRINDGLVEITSKTSATEVVGTVIQDLDGTTSAKPGLWSVEEDSWSDDRGWPRAVHLFEGRLYFGGTAERPQAIWGSRAGDFFSFETTIDSFEDEAVEMTLDNDQVASVEQMFAANSFFAFTSGGVYVHGESPVTPANFFLKRQSEIPAARLRPVEIDGAVAFIRRGDDGTRATCNELVFDEVQQQFVAQDLGLLAGNLINAPVEIAARLGTEADAANHLLVLNQDGTVAVLNTRRAQNIAGWTRLETAAGGIIRSIATVGSEVWCCTQRELDGTTHHLIERLDPDCRLDSAILATPVGATPATAWEGLDLFDGQTVTLYGDGMVLGEFEVSGGAVTSPLAVSTLEVGLPFDWVVESMPAEARLTDGTLIGNRHRMIRATVRVGHAQGFNVNGRRVEGALNEPLGFSAPLPTFSGTCPMRFLGWSGGREGQGATVRITGRSTEPASILSITTEVAQ